MSKTKLILFYLVFIELMIVNYFLSMIILFDAMPSLLSATAERYCRHMHDRRYPLAVRVLLVALTSGGGELLQSRGSRLAIAIGRDDARLVSNQ